jgi:hypothetical protein
MGKAMISEDTLVEDGRRQLIQERCSTIFELLKMDLDELALFQRMMEQFIVDEADKGVKDTNGTLSLYAEGEKREFWAYSHPWYWQDIFASRLRMSYIVSLFSITESHLKAVCDAIAQIIKSPIQMDDLRGGVFGRARKFLWHIGGFDRPTERDWEQITDIWCLRNIIVHRNGVLVGSADERRIRALFGRAPGIGCQSEVMLEIEQGFCDFSQSRVWDFFEQIELEVTSLCEKVENT